MAYKFKLVHGSVARTISEHEAKYRVEKQGVPITGMPAGDGCSHCDEHELHVHASDDDTPAAPPARDPDEGGEAHVAALSRTDEQPLAIETTASGELATAGQGEEAPLQVTETPAPTAELEQTPTTDAAPAAQLEAPAPAPTPPTTNQPGRQGRRAR